MRALVGYPSRGFDFATTPVFVYQGGLEAVQIRDSLCLDLNVKYAK